MVQGVCIVRKMIDVFERFFCNRPYGRELVKHTLNIREAHVSLGIKYGNIYVRAINADQIKGYLILFNIFKNLFKDLTGVMSVKQSPVAFYYVYKGLSVRHVSCGQGSNRIFADNSC